MNSKKEKTVNVNWCCATVRGLERVRCWNTDWLYTVQSKRWNETIDFSLSLAGNDLTDVVEENRASRLCAAAHVDEVKSRADNVNIWQWNSDLFFYPVPHFFFELFDATCKWRQEEEENEIEG